MADPASPADEVAQTAQGWRLTASTLRQQAQAQIDQADALDAKAQTWEDAAAQLVQIQQDNQTAVNAAAAAAAKSAPPAPPPASVT